MLDIPVNRVLECAPGPGLDNSIVGLGPDGAWIALCAKRAVRLGPLGAPREVLLNRHTAVWNSEPPHSTGSVFRRVVPFSFEFNVAVG
jgi:hypothetical protein